MPPGRKFENFPLKQWLYEAGDHRRRVLLKKLKGDLEALGLSKSLVRKGLIQLTSYPHVVINVLEQDVHRLQYNPGGHSHKRVSKSAADASQRRKDNLLSVNKRKLVSRDGRCIPQELPKVDNKMKKTDTIKINLLGKKPSSVKYEHRKVNPETVRNNTCAHSSGESHMKINHKHVPGDSVKETFATRNVEKNRHNITPSKRHSSKTSKDNVEINNNDCHSSKVQNVGTAALLPSMQHSCSNQSNNDNIINGDRSTGVPIAMSKEKSTMSRRSVDSDETAVKVDEKIADTTVSVENTENIGDEKDSTEELLNILEDDTRNDQAETCVPKTSMHNLKTVPKDRLPTIDTKDDMIERNLKKLLSSGDCEGLEKAVECPIGIVQNRKEISKGDKDPGNVLLTEKKKCDPEVERNKVITTVVNGKAPHVDNDGENKVKRALESENMTFLDNDENFLLRRTVHAECPSNKANERIPTHLDRNNTEIRKADSSMSDDDSYAPNVNVPRDPRLRRMSDEANNRKTADSHYTAKSIYSTRLSDSHMRDLLAGTAGFGNTTSKKVETASIGSAETTLVPVYESNSYGSREIPIKTESESEGDPVKQKNYDRQQLKRQNSSGSSAAGDKDPQEYGKKGKLVRKLKEGESRNGIPWRLYKFENPKKRKLEQRLIEIFGHDCLSDKEADEVMARRMPDPPPLNFNSAAPTSLFSSGDSSASPSPTSTPSRPSVFRPQNPRTREHNNSGLGKRRQSSNDEKSTSTEDGRDFTDRESDNYLSRGKKIKFDDIHRGVNNTVMKFPGKDDINDKRLNKKKWRDDEMDRNISHTKVSNEIEKTAEPRRKSTPALPDSSSIGFDSGSLQSRSPASSYDSVTSQDKQMPNSSIFGKRNTSVKVKRRMSGSKRKEKCIERLETRNQKCSKVSDPVTSATSPRVSDESQLSTDDCLSTTKNSSTSTLPDSSIEESVAYPDSSIQDIIGHMEYGDGPQRDTESRNVSSTNDKVLSDDENFQSKSFESFVDASKYLDTVERPASEGRVTTSVISKKQTPFPEMTEMVQDLISIDRGQSFQLTYRGNTISIKEYPNTTSEFQLQPLCKDLASKSDRSIVQEGRAKDDPKTKETRDSDVNVSASGPVGQNVKNGLISSVRPMLPALSVFSSEKQPNIETISSVQPILPASSVSSSEKRPNIGTIFSFQPILSASSVTSSEKRPNIGTISSVQPILPTLFLFSSEKQPNIETISSVRPILPASTVSSSEKQPNIGMISSICPISPASSIFSSEKRPNVETISSVQPILPTFFLISSEKQSNIETISSDQPILPASFVSSSEKRPNIGTISSVQPISPASSVFSSEKRPNIETISSIQPILPASSVFSSKKQPNIETTSSDQQILPAKYRPNIGTISSVQPISPASSLFSSKKRPNIETIPSVQPILQASSVFSSEKRPNIETISSVQPILPALSVSSSEERPNIETIVNSGLNELAPNGNIPILVKKFIAIPTVTCTNGNIPTKSPNRIENPVAENKVVAQHSPVVFQNHVVNNPCLPTSLQTLDRDCTESFNLQARNEYVQPLISAQTATTSPASSPEDKLKCPSQTVLKSQTSEPDVFPRLRVKHPSELGSNWCPTPAPAPTVPKPVVPIPIALYSGNEHDNAFVMDNIYLTLLSLRRLDLRKEVAKTLAIQRNRQEEMQQALHDYESKYTNFCDSMNYLLKRLNSWEEVLQFVVNRLNERTTQGSQPFTKDELRRAMNDVKFHTNQRNHNASHNAILSSAALDCRPPPNYQSAVSQQLRYPMNSGLSREFNNVSQYPSSVHCNGTPVNYQTQRPYASNLVTDVYHQTPYLRHALINPNVRIPIQNQQYYYQQFTEAQLRQLRQQIQEYRKLIQRQYQPLPETVPDKQPSGMKTLDDVFKLLIEKECGKTDTPVLNSESRLEQASCQRIAETVEENAPPKEKSPGNESVAVVNEPEETANVQLPCSTQSTEDTNALKERQEVSSATSIEPDLEILTIVKPGGPTISTVDFKVIKQRETSSTNSNGQNMDIVERLQPEGPIIRPIKTNVIVQNNLQKVPDTSEKRQEEQESATSAISEDDCEVEILTSVKRAEPITVDLSCDDQIETTEVELVQEEGCSSTSQMIPSILEVISISNEQFEKIEEDCEVISDCKDEVDGDEEEGCLNCGEPSKVACIQCVQAHYCSKSCQELHWQTAHHSTCTPLLSPILPTDE